MSLRLYNTLTRQKEAFQPIDPSNVRMYVCGPTVYDFAHIGNARPVIVFDVLFRLLRQIYGAEHVTYVRNITDVDDKINARAADQYPDLGPEVGIRKLTEETAAQFHKDIAALGVLPPTVEPRATDHILEMVALCNQLVAKGHAYVAADHVLFDVSSMADYGRLSNRSLEDMEAGARVEVAPYKKGPMDFVLWKPSKPGEPAWPSPDGIATPGRPGWHIECSAMAGKHLGDVFDIHGGGIDLAFPHHENEIAQSRCAHGTDAMARVWMHNGFLQVEGEKMSKSLGNFITIRELLETTKFGGRKWSGEVLRLAMLSTHYRQPIDWTVALLQQSESRLAKWRKFAGQRVERRLNPLLRSGVINSLEDDLNTSAAFSLIDQVCASETADGRDRHTVFRLLQMLGIGGTETAISRAAPKMRKLLPVIENMTPLDWSRDFFRVIAKQNIKETKHLNSWSILVVAKLAERFREIIAADIDLEWEGFGSLRRSSIRHSNSRRLWQFGFAGEYLDYSPERADDISSAARDLHKVLKDLSGYSRNDWKNFAENVRRSPSFISGRPKPETIVLYVMLSLARNYREICKTVGMGIDSLTQEVHALEANFLPTLRAKEQVIEQLIAARLEARKRKDFRESDRIRDELAAIGVTLKDTKNKDTGEIETTWELAR